MPDTVRVTIPVAYSIPGARIGGVNLDREPIGFEGQFSPYIKNMVVERTRVRKRQGHSRLGSGSAMAGIGSALVLYIDALGISHLVALTTTKAYQYNAVTNVWDDVTGAADWSGDADDFFSHDVVTDSTAFPNNGNSALCVVNNIDDVRYFEGDASDTFATLAHAFPSFSTCREVIEFWNHLFFLSYTDTAARVRSLAASGFANIDDWTSSTSFAATLTDTEGAILRAEKLALDMMIYSERTISMCQYVGGATLYVIPPSYQELGLLSQSSLFNLPLSHFFLGTDRNIYACLQGANLVNIGLSVCNRVFSEVDENKKNRVTVGFDCTRKKVYFAIPTSSVDYPKSIYAVATDLEGYPWEYHEFAHDVRGMAVLQRKQGSLYCDDPEISGVYCDETAMYCDDKFGQAGADIPCFITSTGYVYQLDERLGYDDTTDIECEYQTEDLVSGDEEDFFESNWFSFTAKSQFADVTANVAYSTDGGTTWTDFANSPVTLEQDWHTHRLPLSETARRIRFRVSQSGFGDLQLRGSFKIEVAPCSSRD